MIKIEKIKEPYYSCQSCDSRKNVLKITIGLSERQTSSIRLCKKCYEELIQKSTKSVVKESLITGEELIT